MFHLILYIGAGNGPVAQLNRAADSGSEDRGFESHRDHFMQAEQRNRLVSLLIATTTK